MQRFLLPIYAHSLPNELVFIYSFYAVLCAVVTASQAIAGALAYRFGRLSDRACLALYSAAGLALLVGAYAMRPVSVLCIPLFGVVITVVDIVLDARLQHAIEGEARATVLSVRGFSIEAGGLMVFMGFGAVANQWGYRGGFLTCAVIMVLIGTLYLVLGGPSPFGGRPKLEAAAEVC